jgi:hypothetical protein
MYATVYTVFNKNKNNHKTKQIKQFIEFKQSQTDFNINLKKNVLPQIVSIYVA